MSIEVLTMWYNEAYLAPFFLKHYAYADKITLLYDADTSDNTLKIVESYPNVHVVPFQFPDMMDDELKRDFLNTQYRQTECDWVLCVDADEFVFYKKGNEFCYDLHPFLDGNPEYDLFYVTLYQIYPHADDAELDPDMCPVPQRRYGDPNVTKGHNSMYNKPILVRKGLDMYWTPGCHEIDLVLRNGLNMLWVPGCNRMTFRGHPLKKIAANFMKTCMIFPAGISSVPLLGAHWAMAAPAFAIERRIENRKKRQSRNNLEKGMTVQHHNVTEESIMREFAQHKNDPQLF